MSWAPLVFCLDSLILDLQCGQESTTKMSCSHHQQPLVQAQAPAHRLVKAKKSKVLERIQQTRAKKTRVVVKKVRRWVKASKPIFEERARVLVKARGA